MLKKFFCSTDRPSPFHNSGRGTKRKRSNKSTPPSTFKLCIICQKNIPSPNYVAHVNDCINRAEVRSKQAKSDSVRAENTSGERYDLDTVRKKRKSSVPMSIGTHANSTTRKTTKSFTSHLPGQYIFHDFLTEAEEEMILKHIEATKPKWEYSRWNGNCYTKHWGTTLDVINRTIDLDPQLQIPGFLDFVVERMCKNQKYFPLLGWKPNEVNANYYKKKQNHFLTAHFDDRRLSGELLANISLLGDCEMEFANPQRGIKKRVFLPRRSLQIVSKESRYSWTHAIPRECFFGDERVSLTFRKQGSQNRFQVGKAKNHRYSL